MDSALLLTGAIAYCPAPSWCSPRCRGGPCSCSPADQHADTLRPSTMHCDGVRRPLANVASPTTDVVAYLGTPTGDDAGTAGDGGLAVTRFRAGRPATVFAQAALTGLSWTAAQSLAAHDLAPCHPARAVLGRCALRLAGWLPDSDAGRHWAHRRRPGGCTPAGRAGAGIHHDRRGCLPPLQVAFDRREDRP